jgi:hypothetical protein
MTFCTGLPALNFCTGLPAGIGLPAGKGCGALDTGDAALRTGTVVEPVRDLTTAARLTIGAASRQESSVLVIALAVGCEVFSGDTLRMRWILFTAGVDALPMAVALLLHLLTDVSCRGN